MNQDFTWNFRKNVDRKQKGKENKNLSHVCAYNICESFIKNNNFRIVIIYLFLSKSSSSSLWVNTNIQELQTKW